MHRIKNIFIYFLLLCLTPSFVGAVEFLTTDGGLTLASKDRNFWFKISGVLKLDERAYWGNTDKTASSLTQAGTYNSGAYVRDAGLTFEGGVGENYTYNLALNFDAAEGRSRIDEAYITYHGFKHCAPNFTIDIGQVPPGFCLTCASSSKWIPFMERSMGTNTFSPRNGLGVNFNSYNESYTANFTITQQPQTGVPVVNAQNRPISPPSMWQGATRLSFRPISQPGRVLQIGVSGDIEDRADTGLRYRPYPEMQSGGGSNGNRTISLLDTAFQTGTPGSVTENLIAARVQYVYDIELLGIYGPWSGELEYQRTYITRGYAYVNSQTKQGPNLQFYGYHAQLSYVLTGESRPLKLTNGTLGQIIPRCKYGAWEVSARYSFISLNSMDVRGGLAHNTSASLGWYINRNLKALFEYVYSKQHRQFSTYKDNRHVESFGARLQVVF